MFEWFRNNRYVKGVSDKAVHTLSVFNFGTTAAITVISAINQLLSNPSNRLAYTNLVISGTNQLIGYFLHLINTARQYNEAELLVIANELNQRLMPNRIHNAIAEAGELALLVGTTFYPIGVASVDPDSDNQIPIFVQIVALAMISAALSLHERKIFSRPLAHIKEEALNNVTNAQRDAACSRSFRKWFLRGITPERFKSFNRVQLSVVKFDLLSLFFLGCQIIKRKIYIPEAELEYAFIKTLR